jgi:hypothetical protein
MRADQPPKPEPAELPLRVEVDGDAPAGDVLRPLAELLLALAEKERGDGRRQDPEQRAAG